MHLSIPQGRLLDKPPGSGQKPARYAHTAHLLSVKSCHKRKSKQFMLFQGCEGCKF